jgi:hypothetical protein
MVKKRDGLKPFERILASFFWFQMIELGEKARRLAKLTPPALGLQ